MSLHLKDVHKRRLPCKANVHPEYTLLLPPASMAAPDRLHKLNSPVPLQPASKARDFIGNKVRCTSAAEGRGDHTRPAKVTACSLIPNG